MKKIWMVQRAYNPKDNIAHYVHHSKESAKKEAERLCKLHNESFLILEAIEVVYPKEIPVEWVQITEKESLIGRKVVLHSSTRNILLPFIGNTGTIIHQNIDSLKMEFGNKLQIDILPGDEYELIEELPF